MDYTRQLIDDMYRPKNFLLPYTPYDGPRGFRGLAEPSRPRPSQKRSGSGGGLLDLLGKAKKAKQAYSFLTKGPTSGGPLQSASNLSTYLQAGKSALSSGVGTTSSWYAGLQAGQMGVNEGTQLALIEGSYGPAAAEGASASAGAGSAAASGGALAAIALIGADIFTHILGGEGPLESMLSSHNPKVPFSRNEILNAWKKNPELLTQEKYSDVYAQKKLITALEGVRSSWQEASSRLEQLLGVKLDDVYAGDWEKSKSAFSSLRNQGSSAASLENEKLLDSFFNFRSAAKQLEGRWSSLSPTERRSSSVELAKRWEDLQNTINRSVQRMGGSAPDLGAALFDSFRSRQNLGRGERLRSYPTIGKG